MDFKKFLYSETENKQVILAGLLQFAEKKSRLAKPTTFLDSGQNALVFNTTDPKVVIRVGPPEDCESTLAEEDIQETGGVVKIYFIREIVIADQYYGASWKEKVDTNAEGFLLREHRDKYEEVGSVLSALYHVNREGMRILMNFPPTKNLARAISAGLPVTDLALEMNLGVNDKKSIVAFDC